MSARRGSVRGERVRISSRRGLRPLSGSTALWEPPVDVYETDDRYLLTVEIPGVCASDVHVEVSGNQVVMRGRRRSRANCCDEHYSRVEGALGAFHRTFTLPEPFGAARAAARLKDGLLQVEIMKLPARQP